MKDPSANAKTGATAFTGAQTSLRERLKTASIDALEFQQRMSRCSLEKCRGMCCYDGVPVDDDTAHLVQKLSIERADDFRAMGLALPREVIVDNQWHGVVSKKTAVQPFPFRSLVKDFPDHFEETACVFHLDDGQIYGDFQQLRTGFADRLPTDMNGLHSSRVRSRGWSGSKCRSKATNTIKSPDFFLCKWITSLAEGAQTNVFGSLSERHFWR